MNYFDTNLGYLEFCLQALIKLEILVISKINETQRIENLITKCLFINNDTKLHRIETCHN